MGIAMTTRANSALARLDQLLDWFIPASIAEGEPKQRARMFLLSHIFGPFLGNALPLCMIFLGFKLDYHLFIFIGSITAFWLFPFALKWTGWYTGLAVLSLQILIFTVLWACFSYGGVNSPFLLWLVNIPLLAFFYLSPSGNLKYGILAMFLANIAAFALPVIFGMSYPEADLDALQLPGLLSLVSALAYVAMMALYYASIFASQVDLEQVVHRHRAKARELRLATETARRAGAAKSEFVANMSHELRTPLNAVIGYSQMLLDDAEDRDDRELAADLRKIHGSGQLLLRLVNDVLDFSKIEAGKMEKVNELISIRGNLSELVDSRRLAAAKKGLALSLLFEPNVEFARLDWSLARKAVSHVLENAIKFTNRGSVEIRVWCRGDQLFIVIKDTGPGMSPAVQRTLFDAFNARGDQSDTKYGGAGIGLALSARVCKLLGGDISAVSKEGQGSTFTLRLPLGSMEMTKAA